jgi:hypothetical protein
MLALHPTMICRYGPRRALSVLVTPYVLHYAHHDARHLMPAAEQRSSMRLDALYRCHP